MSILLNKPKIRSLQDSMNLTQNAFAYELGVSRGSLSNAINGRRGVGRKMLVALLKRFPNETVDSLTTKGVRPNG